MKPKIYYCYRSGTLREMLHSEKAVWEWIGESWAPYEVKDANGHTLEEFIPF